jgi:hypothetical protein
MAAAGSSFATAGRAPRVASTEPPRISANAPAMASVNGSPRMDTPSATATAGFT